MSENQIDINNVESLLKFINSDWKPLTCDKHENQELVCICVDSRCNNQEQGQALCNKCIEQSFHRFGQSNHQTIVLKSSIIEYIKSLYDNAEELLKNENFIKSNEQMLAQIVQLCKTSIESLKQAAAKIDYSLQFFQQKIDQVSNVQIAKAIQVDKEKQQQKELLKQMLCAQNLPDFAKNLQYIIQHNVKNNDKIISKLSNHALEQNFTNYCKMNLQLIKSLSDNVEEWKSEFPALFNFELNEKFQQPLNFLNSTKLEEKEQKLFQPLAKDYLQSSNYYLLNSFESQYIEYQHKESQNMEEAIKIIKELQDQNYLPAMTFYGFMLNNGIKVQKDEQQAKNILEKAANFGYASAQNQLGIIYQFNENFQNFKLARKYFKKAATQMHADALFNLGDAFFKGVGVKEDFQKSFHYYAKASKLDHPQAKFQIGQSYEQGKGVQKLTKEAINYYQQAANLGYISAIYQIGKCYFDGNGIPKNLELAAQYYKLASDLGDFVAQYALGQCYHNGWGVEKNSNSTIKQYTLASDQGYSVAMNSLGYCYQEGFGVDKDYEQAIKYYQMASEKGNSSSLYNLGICYQKGLGVEQNEELAIKYYKQSADKGNTLAQCNLGFCYQEGQGVKKDIQQAVEYYKKAADGGNKSAQYNLAYCYYNALGIEQNYQLAFKYYKLSADQGNVPAQFSAGICLKQGIGTEKNYQQAVTYMQQAADAGHQEAQFQLATYYKNGDLAEKNPELAVKYFRQAAHQGSGQAQYWLGYCYETGFGVDKNIEIATKCYKLAIDQGHKEAVERLKKLEVNPKNIKDIKCAQQ